MSDNKQPSKDVPVEKPTWLNDIRYMFTAEDVSHMANHKNPTIHLDDYDDVKQKYNMINAQVQWDGMPPPPRDPWPDAWKQTFRNWKTNNFAKGTQIPDSVNLAMEAAATATRVRKDIYALSSSETDQLIKAFSVMMSREPDDPNSYYSVAAFHGVPEYYCAHMVPPFSSWHRAYMLRFENAMRTVEGCEDITLPYWNFHDPFPELLTQAPFDKYTFQIETGTYKKGDTTLRNTPDQINQAFASQVIPDLTRAMKKSNWQEFHGFFNQTPNNTMQQAHNNGHNLSGPTLQAPDYASYDPMFWFFHCNWDRVWWLWQRDVVNATDWASLKTVMTKTSASGSTTPSYKFFTQNDPLPPFDEKPQDLLDIVSQMGYDYEPSPSTRSANMLETAMELDAPILYSVAAKDKFTVSTQNVNVRVKGIKRLNIPGSFWVHLLKDGERIDSKSHFQFNDPGNCETCVENPEVFFDFELPLETVQNGELSVEIEPNNKDFIGEKIPMSMVGDPTINVRLLLKQE